MAQGAEVTAYFSPREVLFRLGDASILMRLEGSNAAARIAGMGRLPGEVNFLTGPEANWRIAQPMYGAIVYRDLYPGIDMIYAGTSRNLKSEFIVSPAADPGQIRIRYSGMRDLRIDPDGALVLHLADREFREEAPIIYQLKNNNRISVDGRFAVASDGSLSFSLSNYDHSLPLVIDPVVYSTLLGGSNSDAATALTVDSTGAVYVAGFTASYDYPVINPVQNINAGSNDVFVAKLNSAGSGLVYCTYLGGTGDDRANGIAVDASGSVVVTGYTTSAAFPMRSPIQSRLLGAKNAFVFKLNPAGNMLVFSTYLGGSGSDLGTGTTLDSAGNIYVTGDSSSPNFPTTVFQRNNRGAQDAFVAKLASAGSLLFSTYLGGTYAEHSSAIAVDAGGAVYITGSTWSTDFPVISASQSLSGGGQDAFIAKLDPSGSSLIFSTYLGGSGGSLGYPESGQGIALDAQGNAYVTGSTSSPNFPLLHAAQSTRRGSMDAFVVKMSSAGVLVNSTYLGGSGVDTGNAIAIDGAGNAYVAGQTYSSDMPVVSPFQATTGGQYDAFVAKLASTGDTIAFLSYLGGAGSDTATAIALDPAGDVYLAGWTLSTNFPVLNGYQSINGGTYGGFITKVSVGNLPGVVSVTPDSGSGSSQTFVMQYSNSAGATGLTTVAVLFNSASATSAACSVTYDRSANTLALLTDTGGAPAGTISPGSGSQQNSQCILNGSGSSVSVLGNNLTLTLAITFQSGFSGARNIYMQAVNSTSSTGWVMKGSWTVLNGAPSAVSVTPNAGSGSSQTFAFAFMDPRGYAAISTASMIVGSSLSGVGSCYLYYARAANAVYLANDAGNAWLSPAVLGSSGTVQNSQCSVSAATSSASFSGNDLTVNLALSFQAGYAGSKNIYMEVYDGVDSGWQSRGAWTVTVSTTGPPSPVSVTPNSGSGSGQTFAFLFSDPRGFAAINTISMMIGSSLAGAGNCYLYYVRASNAVYLANDAGSAWLAPVVLGTGASAQNSQCTVSGTGSSSSGSGNNLTVNLVLSFQPAYAGSKNVYMEVYDGQDSGWQLKGAWTATVSNVLTPVSVTPAAGSGTTQTFGFLFYDPTGYAAISSTSMLIGTSLAGTNSCYLYYARAANSIYLANDAGTAWLTPAVLGTSATVQNSQCSINVAGSSAAGNGNNLTVNLALTFKPAYAGAKNSYMEVYDETDSGWKQRGTWTAQ